MRLNRKVAIVTGAAGGIGRACALRFAAEGARVVIANIKEGAGTKGLIEKASGVAVAVHMHQGSNRHCRLKAPGRMRTVREGHHSADPPRWTGPFPPRRPSPMRWASGGIACR